MSRAFLAFSSLVLLSSLGSSSCSRTSGEDPSLLIERVWIDSKPEKPTDYMQMAYLLPRPTFGLFSRSSNYDFHLERFDYKRDGQKLKLTLDLCLELSENPWGGPKRYFGKRVQDDEDEASVRQVRAHLVGR